MSSPLEADLRHVNGIPVLSLRGEMRLDIAEAERFLNRLSAGRPPLVILDLSGLTFISSLGMGLLNAFRRGLHSHHGITRIAAAQPEVANALKLCSLDKLFDMHETLVSALNSPAIVKSEI